MFSYSSGFTQRSLHTHVLIFIWFYSTFVTNTCSHIHLVLLNVCYIHMCSYSSGFTQHSLHTHDLIFIWFYSTFVTYTCSHIHLVLLNVRYIHMSSYSSGFTQRSLHTHVLIFIWFYSTLVTYTCSDIHLVLPFRISKCKAALSHFLVTVLRKDFSSKWVIIIYLLFLWLHVYRT